MFKGLCLTTAILTTVIFFCSCQPTQSPESFYFREVSDSLNVEFFHKAGNTGRYHIREPMGSGVALFDHNNDGLMDLFFLNGSFENRGPPPRQKPSNRLFQRLPNGTYMDATETSGLGDSSFSMGVAVGDIDNDGDLDVYVSNYEMDALYLNNGKGVYKDITHNAGIENPDWGAGAIMLDYNLDGFLDIFVTNYGVPTVEQCRDFSGRPDYCGPSTLAPKSDRLYKNNGDLTFTEVSHLTQISADTSRGLGVVSADFNGDGWPDLYVANDGMPNRLWIQKGNHTFLDSAGPKGAAVNNTGEKEAGMGIAIGDVDADGDMDLYVTNFRYESNTLYLNHGLSGFTDETYKRGLASGTLPYTGFGNGFFDFDNDGDLDAAVVNGRVGRHQLLTVTSGYWDWYAEPNLLYENTGRGSFREIHSKAGSFHTIIESSKGLAVGDLNGDGALDMVVNNTGGRARIFENIFPEKGNWITLDPRSERLKRTLYGSVIQVTTGLGTTTGLCQPAYGYLSSHDHRVHFGLGTAVEIRNVIVTWPGGNREEFSIKEINKHHVLLQGTGKR